MDASLTFQHRQPVFNVPNDLDEFLKRNCGLRRQLGLLPDLFDRAFRAFQLASRHRNFLCLTGQSLAARKVPHFARGMISPVLTLVSYARGRAEQEKSWPVTGCEANVLNCHA